MPILHIHSPVRSVEFSSQEEATRATLLEYATRLTNHEARLSVLDPGLKDDITPGCFGPEAGMPEASVGIVIDDTGDRAIVTLLAGSMGLLAQIHTLNTVGRASNSHVQRVPEDTPVVPILRGGIASLGKPRFQLGGLILRLTTDEIEALTERLTGYQS